MPREEARVVEEAFKLVRAAMLSRRARPQLKRDRVEVKRTSRDHKTSRVKVNEELNWLNANPINLAMAVDVIIVNGRVNGRPVRLMIDSGASGCFVKKAFVEMNNLGMKKIDNRNIRLADGKIITTNCLLPEANILVNGRNVVNSFVVMPSLNDGKRKNCHQCTL